MAETPDGMEKSEQPTGKKLGDARDRGLVAKSVDLTSAAVLLFGGLIVFGFGNSLSAQLMAFMKQLIINAPNVVHQRRKYSSLLWATWRIIRHYCFCLYYFSLQVSHL
jgi:flagellar biosynthesis protein FlhB